MSSLVPFPPLPLAERVGSVAQEADPFAMYDAIGERLRIDIESVLPEGWEWGDKRVLDFGCGAGRTLRHFLPEAAAAEFVGCDIDAPSIEWVNGNLSPITAFTNGPAPPLPQDDGAFDLIYAISVFTHLTTEWSSWLLELRRLLADGGMLFATFIGHGLAEVLSGEPWEPDRTGMMVLAEGQVWEAGGPTVIHSPWWIEAHWGRAFDIVEFRPAGVSSEADRGQGMLLMRKSEGPVTRAELEAIDPAEPREAEALARNLAIVQRDVAALRGALADRDRQFAESQRRAEAAERELAHVSESLHRTVTSKSWQLTRPLRDAAGALRAGGRRRD